jgi:hypothetical protein
MSLRDPIHTINPDYSFKYNQQDAMLYTDQGLKNRTHSIGYMPSLLAATASLIMGEETARNM